MLDKYDIGFQISEHKTFNYNVLHSDYSLNKYINLLKYSDIIILAITFSSHLRNFIVLVKSQN